MSHLILFFVFLFYQTFLFSQATEKSGDLILVPQSGHSGSIHSIVFSEDNQYYLTVGNLDGQAHLRNASGKKIRSFLSSKGDVLHSAISPNGKYIVTVGSITSELWDINGNLIKSFSTNGSYTRNFKRAVFSKDSSQFLISGIDEILHLYDTKGNLIHRVLNTKGAHNFAFTSDSKNILIGNYYKGTLEFLGLDGSIQKSIKAYTSGLDYFKIVETKNNIVTLGNDPKEGNSIKLWDLNGNFIKQIYSIKGSNQSYPLEISTDEKTIALPIPSIGLLIIDFDGNEINVLKETLSPTAVAFSKDGNTILVGDTEGNIFRYNARGDNIGKELNTSKDIFSFDYRKNSILLNGSRLLNLDSNQTNKIFESNGYGKFTKDNQFILFMEETKLILFDLAKKKILRTLLTETETTNSLYSIASNNHILINDNSQKQIKILNLDGKILHSFDKIKDNDFSPIISPNGKQILTLSNKYFLRLKDLSGKIIFTVTGKSDEIFKLSFSSTGKYIFVSLENEVEVYDTSGKLLFSLPKTFRAETISSADEKFFLTGDLLGSICIWNSDGKKQKCFLSDGGNIKSLYLSEKNQFIISASSDGLIRYFNFEDSKLALTIHSTDLGLIVISPDGRFDYEDNRALKYLLFRKGETNNLISIDQVFQSYYTPDLFKKVMNGTLPKLKIDIISALNKNLPDLKLEISSEKNKGKIDLNLEACDKGGGLQSIAVYQNGNLIHPDIYNSSLTQKGNCMIGTITLELVNGQNTFKLSANNSANIKAESPDRAVTFVSPESQKPQMHIFVVGVDEYLSKSSKLNFAVQDAKDLRENFNTHGKSAYGKVNIYEVYNSKVTKSGVLNAFKKVINNAKVDDTVVVFFSGHGISIDGKFFYIPHNVSDIDANSQSEYNQKYPAWEKTVIQNSISSDEITNAMTKIKSSNKMLIMDSCQSGGNWMAKMSASRRKQKLDEQRSDMTKKSNTMGIAMISAAQEEDSAFENKKLGHGFLAFSLMEAMKEEKNIGKITAFSTIVKASKKVVEISKQFKKKQVTFVSLFGVDFDLSD